MTISDFLLLATFVAGTLYIIYRLVVGWLATRSAEFATEEPDEVSRAFDEPPTHTGSTSHAPWQSRD